ncbi:Protein of unknown function (DUF2911) [Fodinibius salinus]|uniref:DUF2911 domain-containing protein n=1 Tax=Fodinibius salinus TaxID=860790 RepID=A0A5D3YJG5_9BACT|nr:DUF2911 domain-containing protein [Fodinibius salinus]TYP93702.1 Protein of unknown function (DUF2911) [Fodinibius salinus]
MRLFLSAHKTFILILSTLLLYSACSSKPKPKEPNPVRRKSPIAIANTLHKPSDTYIKVVYGQPYKKGRNIFGELIPYGEIWRTGANEATEITTTQDIILGGKKVNAGTYALFTIPRKNNDWTIVLNDVLGQWGAFNYNSSHDVLRTHASAIQKSSAFEALTIQFSEIVNDSTNMIIQWDHTEVKIPIIFSDSNPSS